MAVLWLGVNAGTVFRRLWTKVHRIKFICVGESVVCNAVFLLTMSCYIPVIFAIKLQSCLKLCQNLDLCGLPNFGGGGGGGGEPPKFLTEFYKSGSSSNMEKFGDDRPSNLGD